MFIQLEQVIWMHIMVGHVLLRISSRHLCIFCNNRSRWHPSLSICFSRSTCTGIVPSTSTNNQIPSGASQYLPPPLPVVLFNFTVQLSGNDAIISWRAEAEVNLSNYVIERSNDAVNFEKIINNQLWVKVYIHKKIKI